MRRFTILLPLLALLLAPSVKAQLNIAFPGSGPIQTTSLSLASGWTLVQNNIQTSCTVGTNSCSFAVCTGSFGNECIAPTVSGSSWIVSAMTGNNVTISSVSGGRGSWQLCPGSACHSFSSTLSLNSDLAYNLSGRSGTQAITVNLSGNSSGFFVAQFAEVLPPPGYTASYDTGGNHADTTCTTSCAGVPLTLSATDFVYQCCSFNINPWQSIGGSPWSSPYLTSPVGNGFGLNVPSGSTSPTTATVSGTGTGFSSSAIAFKSTARSFTYTGSTNFNLVQYTLPTKTAAGSAGQVSCNPSCRLTVPSTGSGHLLVLIEGDTGSNGFKISSVSGAGTWVVPSGAGTCNANAGLSCAYVLSSTSGVTSVSVTLAGSTTTAGFSWWEISRSTGSFTLDTQGAKAQSGTISPVSPTITCTGTNDVVITAIAGSGGVSGAQYMTLGYFPGAALNLQTASPFDPSNGALLNTTNCGPFIFPFENGTSFSSNTFTVAFQ
jgi:hypothetical protein